MITARVTFPNSSEPPPPSNIRYLKKWEQLTGLDAQRYNAGGIDQFGYYSPYITDGAGKWVSDWSVNNLWSYLTHDDMLKIHAMQPTDEYTPAQKMSYLCAWGDSWGNPMRVPQPITLKVLNFIARFILSKTLIANATKLVYTWDTAPKVKMIGAFYAGNPVEVLETKDMLIDYMGAKKITTMCRVRSFSRSDFGTTNPCLVHTMTGVSRDNIYRERVKGIVKLPVALGSDFTFAGGFKPAAWWLKDSWLV